MTERKDLKKIPQVDSRKAPFSIHILDISNPLILNNLDILKAKLASAMSVNMPLPFLNMDPRARLFYTLYSENGKNYGLPVNFLQEKSFPVIFLGNVWTKTGITTNPQGHGHPIRYVERTYQQFLQESHAQSGHPEFTDFWENGWEMNTTFFMQFSFNSLRNWDQATRANTIDFRYVDKLMNLAHFETDPITGLSIAQLASCSKDGQDLVYDQSWDEGFYWYSKDINQATKN